MVALPRAHAQSIPTVGFLRSTPAAPFAHLVKAFWVGMGEMGFVEGRNVMVEYRWADNQLDRLPGLARELVRRKVAVIVGNSQAIEAVRTVTSDIPIVFVTSDDPVKRGLVSNLSRPEGNVTGITFFGGGQLGAKRLELLRELAPTATVIGFLMNPEYPPSASDLIDAQAAASAARRELMVVRATSAREIDPAFATIAQRAKGLIVSGSPLFTSHRGKLVALASQYAMPAIYDVREYVDAGGLMSYAASFASAYRQAGVYVGRILKGAKPSDLPVLQPATFELVINVRTAKALGLAVPQSLLVRADEVVQ